MKQETEGVEPACVQCGETMGELHNVLVTMATDRESDPWLAEVTFCVCERCHRWPAGLHAQVMCAVYFAQCCADQLRDAVEAEVVRKKRPQ